MKIRAITLGLLLSYSDFNDDSNDITKANDKIAIAVKALAYFSASFTKLNYEPQTVRISVNNIEEWCHLKQGNDDDTENSDDDSSLLNVKILSSLLEQYNISFCR